MEKNSKPSKKLSPSDQCGYPRFYAYKNAFTISTLAISTFFVINPSIFISFDVERKQKENVKVKAAVAHSNSRETYTLFLPGIRQLTSSTFQIKDYLHLRTYSSGSFNFVRRWCLTGRNSKYFRKTVHITYRYSGRCSNLQQIQPNNPKPAISQNIKNSQNLRSRDDLTPGTSVPLPPTDSIKKCIYIYMQANQ